LLRFAQHRPNLSRDRDEVPLACGPPKLMKTHVGQVGSFEAIARAP
jgi:hypothetical protein